MARRSASGKARRRDSHNVPMTTGNIRTMVTRRESNWAGKENCVSITHSASPTSASPIATRGAKAKATSTRPAKSTLCASRGTNWIATIKSDPAMATPNAFKRTARKGRSNGWRSSCRLSWIMGMADAAARPMATAHAMAFRPY
eukprot:gene21324-41351_t